jgi:hypothetical protein
VRVHRILTLLAASALLPLTLSAAATFVIVNNDPAGVGFNDTTPAAPVGGNTGVTLGEQRLKVYEAVASVWGAAINSSVPIRVSASWQSLTCTATAAVLGSAGAITVQREFGATPNRWYGAALANKLFGSDLTTTTDDITARFNVNLGNTGCLTGTFFYLGLDNNHGSNVDFFTVLLHELGHGLGFQTFTSGSTGAYLSGFPSVWDDFLLNPATNKPWSGMSDSERVASAIAPLVWTGSNVTSSVPSVLTAGAPRLTVTAPSSVAGAYQVGTASFGPALTTPGVSGEVMPVVDTTGNLGLACSPLSSANAAAVSAKIALVDRGVCSFTIKVKNAQDAGAIGVIVADNVAGSPPAGLGGADATITIPAVRITQADGVTLKTALAKRSRTRSGVFATIGLNATAYSGADTLGRALMYTPNPFQSGSSVSHFDTSASPNLLMEPAINPDLTHTVTTPADLTFQLLKDLGWN